MYKALQVFVLKSAYNVLKITNALKCLSASTSTSACGRNVLESSSKHSKKLIDFQIKTMILLKQHVYS